MHDVRYALRLLRRDRGYAAVAILTMAIGICATTMLFSVVYGVLMKPLPWANADRLMRVTESRKGQQARLPGTISNGAYLAWRDQASTVEAIGGYGLGGSAMTAVADGGEPARLQVVRLTASMFDVLGARPLRGRAFTGDDERYDGGPYPMARVVILSYGLWQEWFGGRDTAIGTVVRLDDQPVTIVGIMPRDFAFPEREARAWLPMPVGGVLGVNGVRRIQIFAAMARLKPGVGPQLAAAEATARARTAPDPGFAAIAMFGSDAPSDVTVTPALDAMTAEVRPALIVLLAAVGLLLATATANLGGLQLARATTRRRELVVRAALGARRGQLVRQLALESIAIGLAGAVVGVTLAVAFQRLLPVVLPADFPRASDIAVNLPVLSCAAALAIVTSVLCGLMPGAETRRLDLARALAEGSAASAAGAGRSSRWARLRPAIMTAQVALACVLLLGAALLTRSFTALMHADRGYDAANILTARLDLPPQSSDGPRHLAIADAVVARMRARIGVRTAAAADALPFLSLGSALGTEMPSPLNPAVKLQVRANLRMVDAEYFAALRIRLLEGRLLSDADGASSQPVVVVSRSFARQYLGPQPIGHRVPLRSGRIGRGADAEVVGVVEDLQTSVTEPPAADLFIAYRQFPDWWTRGSIIFVVRTTDDPLTHVQALRAAVREQDPTVALDSIMTMEDRVASSLAKPRLYAALLVAFAAAALIIATVGLFGLLSYLVAQRSREIGIRTALGAQVRDIVGLVLTQAMAIGAAGLSVGLLCVYGLTRYLSSFLYGVARTDPLSYAIVAFAVGFVVAVACLVPARRAARIDPLVALRAE